MVPDFRLVSVPDFFGSSGPGPDIKNKNSRVRVQNKNSNFCYKGFYTSKYSTPKGNKYKIC